MYHKFLTALITGLLLNSNAVADSFCGFDQGLVGTKAIGYIAPYSLDYHKMENDACELNVFETPSDAAQPVVRPCTDFQHVPSNYVDEYASEEFYPVGDYFYLQLFDATDIWVQIALKSGDKKWVQQRSANPSSFPYQYKADDAAVVVERHHPTQGAIYLAPSLNKPAGNMGQYLRGITDGWIDRDIPLGFFDQEVFKLLAKHELFNPRRIEEGVVATYYADFLDVGYEVKSIIKDDDGREWLKAEEYLEISNYALWDYISIQLEEQGASISKADEASLEETAWEAVRSKAGRTVYFPYREPSGTITMVMTDGQDCGC